MSVPTREVTIYRRIDDPSLSDFDGADISFLDEHGWRWEMPDHDDAEILFFHGDLPEQPASWRADAVRLLGSLPEYPSKRSGLLLFVSVKGDGYEDTYLIGFGIGYRIVLDAFKDQHFGLRFAVRAMDPGRIREVVRRSMSGSGRLDSTHLREAVPIGQIGVKEYTEIVRKIGGEVDPAVLGLKPRRGAVSLEGSAGLRLRIPLDLDQLVRLLHLVSRIHREPVPEEFAFVESLVPVTVERTREALDARLSAALHGDDDTVTLSPAVPVDLLSDYERAQSYRLKLLGGVTPPWPDLDLDRILKRCRSLHQTPSIQALRKGQVEMYSDRKGERRIAHGRADRWVEASLTHEGDHYVYLDGEWYVTGAEYFASVRRQVAAMFRDPPCIDLPPWKPTVAGHERKGRRGEPVYNEQAAEALEAGGVLNLDRALLKTVLHDTKGFEACDLLGPRNELVHIKQGGAADGFGYQLTQVLVSTEALCLKADARKQFADLVKRVSGGRRELPPLWRPEKVVLAMRVERKTPLSADTLFPNIQVGLVHLAYELRTRFGVDLEVIPIPEDA